MSGVSTLISLIVGATAFLGAMLIRQLRVRRPDRRLVLSGHMLRIVGGLAYLFLIGSVYGGGENKANNQRMRAGFTVNKVSWRGI